MQARAHAFSRGSGVWFGGVTVGLGWGGGVSKIHSIITWNRLCHDCVIFHFCYPHTTAQWDFRQILRVCFLNSSHCGSSFNSGRQMLALHMKSHFYSAFLTVSRHPQTAGGLQESRQCNINSRYQLAEAEENCSGNISEMF